MSLVQTVNNGVNENCLSSNDKVMHYLQNSTFRSTTNNSLSMLKRSPSTNLYLLQHRLRHCSENDSISSSSSSAVGSSTQSELSSESSLSDPVAHGSIGNSNRSSEDIDFNIGFDQISDDDDDGVDDDNFYSFYYDISKLTSKKNGFGM